jgi:mono/diheme cytochrome c family protein
VVARGVPGTTMPAWGQFLSATEIGDVAHYLIALSPRHLTAWRAQQLPRPLASSPSPPDLSSAAAVAAGAALWRRLQCGQCHGADGKGGGPSAADLVDEWGRRDKPTDVTYRWSFRNGAEPPDLYRTLVGGLNGTPMPSYAPALPDEADRWRLVAYVASLSPASRPVTRLDKFKAARLARPPVAPAPAAASPSGADTMVRVGGANNACTCTQRIEPPQH